MHYLYLHEYLTSNLRNMRTQITKPTKMKKLLSNQFLSEQKGMWPEEISPNEWFMQKNLLHYSTKTSLQLIRSTSPTA